MNGKAIAMDNVLRKPRSCDGCKAHSQSLWRHTCELGYEIKSEKIGSIRGVDILRYYPAKGRCPKPRTINELINSPRGWEEGAK